ncbi:hypothetical protein Pla175_48120 [Pirellulimonas nuda]|uniref:Phytase-like domain-containing protein n=1 Tax=Pirellulimonas nuda TaxID=2528009 RepID=A0A518DIU2_9BACT|nr:esterase-like activity of phytase family protein [Pirellulimonas nuda]QDU91390.1 hypothetical protein Pla175_48120 [Pirellulimonas nuda]
MVDRSARGLLAPSRACLVALAALGASLLGSADGAPWTVTLSGIHGIDPGAFVGVSELSGVAYAGPTQGGAHRFLAVSDGAGVLTSLDVTFSATGAITSAAAAATLTLGVNRDFEGVALVPGAPDRVYLSEEGTPAVRAYDLTTGAEVQSLSTPAVFATRRGNRGFESLAASPGGGALWTANEDALTADGPATTTSAGSVVRLLRYDRSGATYAPAQQYAYPLDAIHAAPLFGQPQAGLSDLVVLPDGALVAMERSFAATLSVSYRHRLYLVDASTATDVGTGLPASGLIGNAYAPVTKTLLWSGTVNGSSGQNLEGLTLGPQLADGSWVLLGVVDDSSGGDPFSTLSVVSFVATAPTPTTPGDYNGDGAVDARDLDAWRASYGNLSPAGLGADGNGDGQVNAADYTVWRDAPASPAPVGPASVPEPSALWLAGVGLCLSAIARKSGWLGK